MCTSVYSSLLPFILATITIFVMKGTKMEAEGLPISRQELGADRGILAGADFLSIFVSSSLQHASDSRSVITSTEISTTPQNTVNPNNDDLYVRNSRSTPYITTTLSQPNTEDDSSFYSTTISAQLPIGLKQKSSDPKLNKNVVFEVSISSLGDQILNDKQSSIEDTTIRESTTEYPDESLIISEQRPSVIAESNKNLFSVEEIEPITTNRDLTSEDFRRSFSANVQSLPRTPTMQFHPTSGFISQAKTDGSKPFHQTIIFHNDPKEPNRSRSVSYSTVIQSVPNLNMDKKWEDNKPFQNDRHERHYGGTQTSFANNFQIASDRAKFNQTMKENESYFQSNPKENWEKPEETTAKAEQNWENVQKLYPPSKRLPTVYGQPEQNYEVDESASVMTNGRIHGIQPSRLTLADDKQKSKSEDNKKADDNQKVGYVVEGRNYRKYRVEERTSDGFIVGEYGVVSHDDGSLRGVRYTADGTINPRLIYDALMKFLSL